MTTKTSEKQKKIIHYLINAKNGCSITELMKLAYLLDIGFKKVTGKTFTNFQFKRYYYGPFTAEIYKIVDKLLDSNHVFLDESLAVDGKSIYKVKTPLTYECFTTDEVELMNQLLQEIVNLNALQLTNLAYKTEPMRALGATLGGNENLNEMLDFNKVKSLEGGGK